MLNIHITVRKAHLLKKKVVITQLKRIRVTINMDNVTILGFADINLSIRASLEDEEGQWDAWEALRERVVLIACH